jgi:hypothetical protein
MFTLTVHLDHQNLIYSFATEEAALAESDDWAALGYKTSVTATAGELYAIDYPVHEQRAAFWADGTLT